VEGLPPVRLAAGDVVVFPHGDAHVLSNAPGLRPNRITADWVYARRHQSKPMPLSFHHGVVEPGAAMPLESAEAVIVCGFIGCDLRPFNTLVASLPRILHVPAAKTGRWVAHVIDQAAAESREPRAGSDALLAKLSEMLFVEVVRIYADSLPDSSDGWLGGLRDRYIGKALAMLHDKPAKPWTIEDLGREVGLSRSALHGHFLRLIGQTPMQYLTNWRMQLASTLLRTTSVNVASVAVDVGYDSEAAFARAFKRAVGMPPATWRGSGLAKGQNPPP
jgi:AraC-like DNA-binding protein